MPIYEYRCEQCGCNFEIRASIKEKEVGLKAECPTCHGQRVQQVIGAGLLMRVNESNDHPASCCGPDAKPGCCS